MKIDRKQFNRFFNVDDWTAAMLFEGSALLPRPVADGWGARGRGARAREAGKGEMWDLWLGTRDTVRVVRDLGRGMCTLYSS